MTSLQMAENSCVSSAPGYSQKYWPHWQTHQIIFITKKLYLLFQNMKHIWQRVVVWAAHQDIPQNIDYTEEQTTPKKITCIHLSSFCITKKLYLLFQNMKDIWQRIVVWAANQDIPQNIDHTEEQTTHPPNKECLSTHIEQSQSCLTVLFFVCLELLQK